MLLFIFTMPPNRHTCTAFSQYLISSSSVTRQPCSLLRRIGKSLSKTMLDSGRGTQHVPLCVCIQLETHVAYACVCAVSVWFCFHRDNVCHVGQEPTKITPLSDHITPTINRRLKVVELNGPLCIYRLERRTWNRFLSIAVRFFNGSCPSNGLDRPAGPQRSTGLPG